MWDSQEICPGGRNKVPKKKVKLDEEDNDNDEDNNEDEEEMGEKTPVKKFAWDTTGKMDQTNENRMEKDLKPSTPRWKSDFFKILQNTGEKLLKHQKDIVL